MALTKDLSLKERREILKRDLLTPSIAALSDSELALRYNLHNGTVANLRAEVLRKGLRVKRKGNLHAPVTHVLRKRFQLNPTADLTIWEIPDADGGQSRHALRVTYFHDGRGETYVIEVDPVNENTVTRLLTA